MIATDSIALGHTPPPTVALAASSSAVRVGNSLLSARPRKTDAFPQMCLGWQPPRSSPLASCQRAQGAGAPL